MNNIRPEAVAMAASGLASIRGGAVPTRILWPGCASLVNTAAQDVAWSRWALCHRQAIGTETRNVQVHGRIAFSYSGPGDRQVMLDGLRQSASTGPALPEPSRSRCRVVVREREARRAAGVVAPGQPRSHPASECNTRDEGQTNEECSLARAPPRRGGRLLLPEARIQQVGEPDACLP
jgi:hypothetical protein